MAGIAEVTPAVYDHEASAELLSRNAIELNASGTADISFEHACDILCRADMLVAIQRGYANTLPEGEVPEFTVRQTAATEYQYVNRHQQRTRIEEVGRVLIPEKKVIVALYSEGRRFFGPYQSLCQVEVTPAGSGVEYRVLVYARPESGIARFFARMTPVELYFRHKTAELTDLVVAVCNQILTIEEEGENHVVCTF